MTKSTACACMINEWGSNNTHKNDDLCIKLVDEDLLFSSQCRFVKLLAGTIINLLL